MDLSGIAAMSCAALCEALDHGHALIEGLNDLELLAVLLALMQRCVQADLNLNPLALHEMLNAVTRAALEDQYGTPSEPENVH